MLNYAQLKPIYRMRHAITDAKIKVLRSLGNQIVFACPICEHDAIADLEGDWFRCQNEACKKFGDQFHLLEERFRISRKEIWLRINAMIADGSLPIPTHIPTVTPSAQAPPQPEPQAEEKPSLHRLYQHIKEDLEIAWLKLHQAHQKRLVSLSDTDYKKIDLKIKQLIRDLYEEDAAGRKTIDASNRALEFVERMRGFTEKALQKAE